MIRGGATGFFVFLSLFLSVIIYPPLGEGVVGRMLGEFPTPIPLLKGISSMVFGSSTDERGILFVLIAVCLEFVLVGVLIGYIFHRFRTRIQRNRMYGENE
jgi:hypothetical protein